VSKPTAAPAAKTDEPSPEQLRKAALARKRIEQQKALLKEREEQDAAKRQAEADAKEEAFKEKYAYLKKD